MVYTKMFVQYELIIIIVTLKECFVHENFGDKN